MSKTLVRFNHAEFTEMVFGYGCGTLFMTNQSKVLIDDKLGKKSIL